MINLTIEIVECRIDSNNVGYLHWPIWKKCETVWALSDTDDKNLINNNLDRKMTFFTRELSNEPLNIHLLKRDKIIAKKKFN